MGAIMKRRDYALGIVSFSLATGMLMAGCTTTVTPTVSSASRPATNERVDEHVDIHRDANATLERLYSTVSDGRELVRKANGILVFPHVFAAGLGVGGEYGKGELRIHGRSSGYYSLASLSVGLQIGAQSKEVILLFMTQEALDKFRASNGWSAGADASVAVLKVGANGAVDSHSIDGPVLAFVMTNAGLMANLTLAGTKISRLN